MLDGCAADTASKPTDALTLIEVYVDGFNGVTNDARFTALQQMSRAMLHCDSRIVGWSRAGRMICSVIGCYRICDNGNELQTEVPLTRSAPRAFQALLLVGVEMFEPNPRAGAIPPERNPGPGAIQRGKPNTGRGARIGHLAV